MTAQSQAKFNAVEEKFAALDDLVLNFNTTATAPALVAADQAAGVVHDLGGSPSKPAPAPAPAPAPTI